MVSAGSIQVSVVLPARNEAATIAEVIRRVDAALEFSGWTREIIVGDSASTDGTAAVAFGSGVPVRMVREVRPGKGRILTAAFRMARGDVLAFIDADLDLAPEDLPAVIRPVMDGAACAAARKTGPAAAHRPWRRRVGSQVANTVLARVLGTGLSDHQTGLKAFDGALLRSVLPDMKETGWLWDTEVLWHIRNRGRRTVEVPVELVGFRTSEIDGIRGGLHTMREVYGLCARLVRQAAPGPSA